MTRAQLDKRPADVAAMFDQVAGRYDLLNDVLSLGQDRWWRKVVAKAVAAQPGERILDLAAGTGTSAVTFTATGAACVACDFSLGMLRAGDLVEHGGDVGRPLVQLRSGHAFTLAHSNTGAAWRWPGIV